MLAVIPFSALQYGTFLHILIDISQYDDGIQFELPQRQAAELAVTPSELLHGIL